MAKSSLIPRSDVLLVFTPEQPRQEQGDIKAGLQSPNFQLGPPLPALEFLENYVAFLPVSVKFRDAAILQSAVDNRT